MVTSLAHVLLITPVLFYWLRSRTLAEEAQQPPRDLHPSPPRSRTRLALIGVIAAALLLAIALATLWSRSSDTGGAPTGKVIQELQSGDLRVALRNESGGLHQGGNAFTLEFRSAANNELVDVGDVRLAGAMTMPGMTMSGGIKVQRIGRGRYSATADFGMSGAWRFSLDWNGPAGAGSLTFTGDVR
jgi:hypothetical protein